MKRIEVLFCVSIDWDGVNVHRHAFMANNPVLYMTSSLSGQVEPNLALWLATQARWSYLARSGYGLCPAWKIWCFIPYNESFIDQACSVKMAGYRPRSFFFGQYPAMLTSRFVNNPYILTEQVWVINDLLTLFSCGTRSGNPVLAR